MVSIAAERTTKVERAVQAGDGVTQIAAASAMELERGVFQAVPAVYPSHCLCLAPRLRGNQEGNLGACGSDFLDKSEQCMLKASAGLGRYFHSDQVSSCQLVERQLGGNQQAV